MDDEVIHYILFDDSRGLILVNTDGELCFAHFYDPLEDLWQFFQKRSNCLKLR